MKKMIMTTVCSLLFLSQSLQADRIYPEELSGYVQEIVAHLFFPKHEKRGIKKLTEGIVKNIRQNHGLGRKEKNRHYESKTVYDVTLEEVINFVEQKAYDMRKSFYVSDEVFGRGNVQKHCVCL